MIPTIEYPYDPEMLTTIRYPAGEVQVRLTEKGIDAVRYADKVIVSYRYSGDSSIIGLAQLSSAIRGLLKSLDRVVPVILIIPYLPYARADRRFVSGDCFGLYVFGDILASMGFDQIYTLDVHSAQASRYTAAINVPPDRFIQMSLEEIDKKTGGTTRVLLPDEGASRYGYGTLPCSKIRNEATGEITGFKVPPKGAFGDAGAVLIIDDICDGGATFLGIAAALESYKLDLYLYVSHGIFSKGTDKLLEKFMHIYTTDSIHRGLKKPGVTVYPCEGEIRQRFMSLIEVWEGIR